MKILLSEYAGACYGVQRALSLVYAAARGKKPVHTLGPLIHNPRVVAGLGECGVKVAERVDEVEDGVLVIRSHGVAPQIIDEARARGLEVVDATCPHVLKAQQAAYSLRCRGYTVLVVGESGHPEVESIRSHAGAKALVVQTPDDLPDSLLDGCLPGSLPDGGPSDSLPDSVPKDLPGTSSNTLPRIGVVVQTTQSPETLEAIIGALRAREIKLEVHDTICSATRQRQQSAARLAREVDCMLVVGGHNSGNTTRLYEICKAVCPNTHHIESPSELDFAWFADARAGALGNELVVGITAGASTPQEQITSVVEALKAKESNENPVL